MKTQEIKFQNLDKNYSILIGNNILHLLKNKIKSICPKTKKIALVFDKNVLPSLELKNSRPNL